MLCLKLLCAVSVMGLAVCAPHDVDTFLQNAKKRVERNRRQLLPGSVEEKKLDLENYAPLQIVEKSLEKNDGEGDNEINGTKSVEDRAIQYYHKKNKGTVKTIVEEKDKDTNKMENVFYHVSYEKQDPDTTLQPLAEDADGETTDMTLPDETTLPDEDEVNTMTPDHIFAWGKNWEMVDAHNKEALNDATIPSQEDSEADLEPAQEMNQQSVDQNDQQNSQNSARWFNGWFHSQSSTPSSDTPHLDSALLSSQFTILSPFYFGSIGMRSPSCPAHRPTLVSIYFFSFCV